VQQKKRNLRYFVCGDHLRSPDRGRGGEVPPRKRFAVSRGRRGIEIPHRAATMRKTVPVLALIAFACDFSARVLVHGNLARKSEAVLRSDGYQVTVTSIYLRFDALFLGSSRCIRALLNTIHVTSGTLCV